jgi:iron complex transport system substrate-binding protein
MDRPTMKIPLATSASVTLFALIVTSMVFAGVASGPVRVVGADTFPMSVVDGFGRNVTIVRVPQRVVSLSPSITEVLFAIRAGSKVVGVTRYCDYPPEVLVRVGDGSLKVVGGFTDPNIEVIVSLKPDLILASSDLQNEVVSSLEAKGLTVFGLAPRTIDEIVENIRTVGRILDLSESAERLVENMTTRIDTIVNKMGTVAEKPRIYYEVWYDPLMSIGQGTWVNDLITLAGGVNIFGGSKASYPLINSETVVAADPQIIIVSKGYMGGIEQTRSSIRDRPGWSSISAVRNNRIYAIEEDTVYRHGPRIVDGLETLALIIHPELFPETGMHSLTISTSPAVRNVVFEIDGIHEWTDNTGVISLTLKKGSHMVKVLNSSIMIGSDKLEFSGWSGTASGNDGSLSIYLESDSTLTANYHYTATTQFNYAVVTAAIAVAAITATLVFRLRSRQRETN